MGTYLQAAERLSDQLWLFRGHHDRDARHRQACRVLAGQLGCDEGSVLLRADERGKPHVAAPRSDLCVSLSHRPGMVLIGIAPAAIGVDVEWVEDGSDVAGQLFGPAESHWLGSVDQADAFARLWTGKEAVLKAAGQGVALGVAEPDFAPHLRPGHPFLSATCAVAFAGDIYSVRWHALVADGRTAMAASAVLAMPGSHFRAHPFLPPHHARRGMSAG